MYVHCTRGAVHTHMVLENHAGATLDDIRRFYNTDLSRTTGCGNQCNGNQKWDASSPRDYSQTITQPVIMCSSVSYRLSFLLRADNWFRVREDRSSSLVILAQWVCGGGGQRYGMVWGPGELRLDV